MEFKSAKDFRDFLFSLLPPPVDNDERRNIIVSVDCLVDKKFPKIKPIPIIPPHSLVKNNNKNLRKRKPKNQPLTEIQDEFMTRQPTRPNLSYINPPVKKEMLEFNLIDFLTEQTFDPCVVEEAKKELLDSLENPIPTPTSLDLAFDDFEKGSFQNQLLDLSWVNEALGEVDIFTDFEEELPTESNVNNVDNNNFNYSCLSMPVLTPWYDEVINHSDDIPVLNSEVTDSFVNKVDYKLLIKDLELSSDEDEEIVKRGVGIPCKNIKTTNPTLNLALKKCIMANLSDTETETEVEEDIEDAVIINRKNLDLVVKKMLFDVDLSENESSSDGEKTEEKKIQDKSPEPRKRLDLALKKMLFDVDLSENEEEKTEEKIQDKSPEPRKRLDLALKKMLFDVDLSENESSSDGEKTEEDVFVKQKKSIPEVESATVDKKKKSFSRRTRQMKNSEPKIGEIFPFSYLYFRSNRVTCRTKNVKVPEYLPRLGSIFPFKNSLFAKKQPFPVLGKIFPFHNDIYANFKLSDIFPFENEYFTNGEERETVEKKSETTKLNCNTKKTKENNDSAPVYSIDVLDKEDLELILNTIHRDEIPQILAAMDDYRAGKVRLYVELRAPHPSIKIVPVDEVVQCDDREYVGGGKLPADTEDGEKKKILKKVYDKKSKKETKEEKVEPKIQEIYPFEDEIIEPARNRVVLRYIQIQEIGRRYIKKFSNHIIDYKIRFKKNLPKLQPCDLVTKALDEMIEYTKKETRWKEGDKMSVVAENKNFNNPISTGYSCSDMTKKLKDKIMQIVTSDESVVLTECIFTVHVVNMPRGAHSRRMINLKQDKRTKRSILQINNDDNLCAPRAIVTALTYRKNKILDRHLNENDISYIRKGRSLQTDLAIQLCMEIGDFCPEGFTLEDIRSCEEVLNIQIKIICAENFNNLIYKGWKECKTKIYLYKQGNHYDVITKLGSFYGSVYYCEKCDKGYRNKNQHKCKPPPGRVCNMCMKAVHPKYTKDKVLCTVCNRYSYNEDCFAAHCIEVCPFVFKCPQCCKIIRRSEFSRHQCGYTMCRNCKEVVVSDTHQCYMLRKVPKGSICGCKTCTPGSDFENKKCTYTEKYIFFDYEAQQETGTHKPNLVVAKYFNGDTFTFDTNDAFCEWLISRKHQGYTAIAHYARGYDSQFILQYLVANTLKPHTIYCGTKIMVLEVSNLGFKVIDSHNFVAAPLSAFPKTFNLLELKKGYFPHYFNTKENENYVGPIPEKKFYGFDTMKDGDRKKFIEWHDKKVEEGYVFDMQKELLEYCDSDVDILRKGCLDFRKQFLDIENIDPFCYVTIASVCMAVYRCSYLEKNTIAVLENSFTENFSKQSILWLDSLNNSNIKHALTGGEVEICGAKVDGYDDTTKTVYQYHGCFWHGCPKCYSSDFINNVKKETMDDLLQQTKDRTKQLEREGYKVVEEWECKWVKTKEYKKLCKEREIIEPLNPRDALFGGRTEVFKLKYEKKKSGETTQSESSDEELVGKYADVVSLYPSVMYYDYYPIGHPRKILRPSKYDQKWFGIIKCKVLPPKDLYIPVLPVRVKMDKAEKLVFPLCIKCSENQQPVCNHTDIERQFIGTWSTVEVSKAIEMGYQLKEMYEVWDFDKSADLWKGYVTAFMKIKLETSPHNYPSNEAYVKDIEEKMGIKLDIDKITPNPGKRAVSKLCLNSLWGKFGQRQNMPQTEFVADPCRFYEILLDERLKDINVIYVSDEMVQVNYRYIETYVENHYNTNIFVALYTTANARMRLYEQLSRLDKYVMYCDTDSIVYLDNGKNTIPHGDMLAEWTDELDGGYIQKWVATGPKSYHYVTNTGKVVTKVKGFTLHHKNALKINGAAMEKLIDSEIRCVSVQDNQITRDPETKELINKILTKRFSFGFDKRVITQDYNTKPYGYAY
ncbi:hypothetical protein V9T40_006553 [Parthenolecanium corni]|uniref:DNA-directed DNA polymerase n=1 Tax=Parthenolecanium corni TaxID=536013 RepID=A0AAN9TMX3_9HEMI